MLGAMKKSRSLMGRAVRRCASRAGPSRPFDTKLVLCRIILMSSNQVGAWAPLARRQRQPPALEGPGRSRRAHTGCGAGSERFPA